MIDTGETNGDAIGVQLSNASVALSLMKPVSGGNTKYIGLKATASSLGFVGVDAFEIDGANIVVTNDTLQILNLFSFLIPGKLARSL